MCAFVGSGPPCHRRTASGSGGQPRRITCDRQPARVTRAAQRAASPARRSAEGDEPKACHRSLRLIRAVKSPFASPCRDPPQRGLPESRRGTGTFQARFWSVMNRRARVLTRPAWARWHRVSVFELAGRLLRHKAPRCRGIDPLLSHGGEYARPAALASRQGGASQRSPLERQHLGSVPERVEVVAPPLGHSDALLPVRAAVVGCPHLIEVLVRERPLDGIGRPVPDSFSSVLAIARKPCAVISSGPESPSGAEPA
jgi:hypothetical protein